MHLMQEGNVDFLAFSVRFSFGATVSCIVLLPHPQTEQSKESDSSLVSALAWHEAKNKKKLWFYCHF